MSPPKTSIRVQGLRTLGAGLACLGVALGAHFAGYVIPALIIVGLVCTVGGATLAVWGDGFQKLDGQQKLLAAAISVLGLLLVGALVLRAFGR
jgi:hypothetical protein